MGYDTTAQQEQELENRDKEYGAPLQTPNFVGKRVGGKKVVEKVEAPKVTERRSFSPEEGQKEVLKMVNPQNFLPVHGEYAFLQAHAAMAEDECGIKNTNVIRNGQMIGFGAKRNAKQVGELGSLSKVIGNVKAAMA